MTVRTLLVASSVLACSLTFISLPATNAQGQQNKQPAAQTRDPLAIYKATGISKEQEDKIMALTRTFESTLAEGGNKMIGYMRDMRAMSLQVDPDRKAVLAKQDEINKLNNETSVERIKLMLDIRNVLTHDQRKKLVQLMQESPGKKPAETGGAGSK